MKSISEAMKCLKENDNKEIKVELGNAKRVLYSQDELDLFNVIKNRIHGLEPYVTNFNITLSFGTPTAYVEFGTSNSNKSAFDVMFDTENFGKVNRVTTTYSNQEVTSDFVNLAQELYKLKD